MELNRDGIRVYGPPEDGVQRRTRDISQEARQGVRAKGLGLNSWREAILSSLPGLVVLNLF